MRLLAAAVAVFALGAAPLPAPTPSPAPTPLKEIASVRAQAFCALSKKNAVEALTALASTEVTLDAAFNRLKKANTSNSAAMDLMVMNLQNHIHAALNNINKANDLLKKLREAANSRDDKQSKDAALAVIATLDRDRKLETEMMNRIDDFAESYMMYEFAAGDEAEAQMRSATGVTFDERHATPEQANSLTVSALATQTMDEARREELLQSLFSGMTYQTLDLDKATMGDLHNATLDAYGATEALIAVCNK